MKSLKMPGLIAASLFLATAALAQAPAGAPAGSTALCKDGTYYSGATRKGACRGHKGVKEWWGAEAGAAAPAMAMKSAAAPAASPPSPASTAMAPATAPKAAPRTPVTGAAAAGGGAGQVWVNHPTKVYHCPGDRWYGKTKDGEYMSEADAAAKGYRPDHGRPCK